tara:strand:- start:1251 stop:1688 length:438 start_codon:yes stop_codon:yes gene_type:complete
MSGMFMGFVSLFITAFGVSQVGNLHRYYVDRSKEWERARAYLSSENCVNPLMRAKLGTFNLCERSENIMSRYPSMSAIHDVAVDLNVCGHDRCAILYVDVTNNLHKIVVTLLVFSVLGAWIFAKACADRKYAARVNKFTLPTKRD